jgi:hypothetical protein
MLFYFEESSYFLPKQIDKPLEEQTLSCQMCFVSSESIISAKKIHSFAKSKIDFFSQKETQLQSVQYLGIGILK